MPKKQEKKLWNYLEESDYADLPEKFIGLASSSEKSKAKTSKRKAREKSVAALKRFQSFAALPATGRINKATLEQVDLPHCSFPDVTTEELTLLSLSPPRWNTRNISYGFSNSTNQIPFPTVQQAIKTAFGIWTTAFPFVFREVSLDDNPMIIISFVRGSHGDGFPFQGGDGDLAHAFPPNHHVAGLAGDIHFDDVESWSVMDLVTKKDLITVGVHEIGHSLGLGHSPNSASIMFKTYLGPRRFLDGEDIAKIRNLYLGL
jgi:hypothetical protein